MCLFSDNYKDIVSDITNTKIEDNKINLYLFRGEDVLIVGKKRNGFQQ